MIDRIREAGEAFERKVEAHGMPPNCRMCAWEAGDITDRPYEGPKLCARHRGVHIRLPRGTQGRRPVPHDLDAEVNELTNRIKELEAEVTRLQAQLEGARAACQALRTGPARLVKEWRAQAAAEANPRVAVALD